MNVMNIFPMEKWSHALRMVALCTFVACAGVADEGTGAVAFSSWGEEYIEDQIPASAFEDGWSVKYGKFLVVVGEVRVADSAGSIAAIMPNSVLLNHVTAGVKPVVSFAEVPARAWDRVSYVVLPASPSTERGNATESDLAFMRDGGFSVYVEGVATKGAVQKSFAWGFRARTEYARCRGALGGKEVEGVVVTRGGADNVELTVHGDHLFYDDLQSSSARLRFSAMADADERSTGNRDGVVSLAELSAYPLVEVPPAQGGYGTGALSRVHDLGAFVAELSRTVGHFRGEGECFTAGL